jgi:hypothetical protein
MSIWKEQQKQPFAVPLAEAKRLTLYIFEVKECLKDHL